MEVLPVTDSVENRLRQVVEYRGIVRVRDVAGAELQTAHARNGQCSVFDFQLPAQRDERFRDIEDPGFRHGQTQQGAELCSQILIRQDADILRIVPELDDVVLAIGRAHQVCL